MVCRVRQFLYEVDMVCGREQSSEVRTYQAAATESRRRRPQTHTHLQRHITAEERGVPFFLPNFYFDAHLKMPP